MQTLKPFILANIFKYQKLTTTDNPSIFLEYRQFHQNISISQSDIYIVKYNLFKIFAELIIVLEDKKQIRLSFLNKPKALSFINLFSDKLKIAYSLKLDKLGAGGLIKDFKFLFNSDKYIAYSDIISLKNKYDPLVKFCSDLITSGCDVLIDDDKFIDKIKKIADFSYEEQIKKRNEKYINKEKELYKDLFVNKKGQNLTDEQIKAVITLEDRNILIAAAGSGKTETLIFKLKYILEKGLYKPDNILLLTFNASVREELKKRIKALNIGLDAKKNIHTFNSFGYNVMIAADKKKKEVVDVNYFSFVVNNIIFYNKKYMNLYIEFITYYLRDEGNNDPYNEYFDTLANTRNRSRTTHKTSAYKTIKGDMVKSYQEAVISNYLYIHGVNFEYEKPYISKKGKQVIPDFYYPDLDLYHEHFAIDVNGKSNFGEEYVENMNKKIKMFKKEKAAFIQTTSAMFYSDTLLPYLEKELKSKGVKFNVKSINEIRKDLDKIQEDRFYKIIASFLSIVKDKQLDVKKLITKAGGDETNKYKRKRNLLFLKIFDYIYKEYEKKIKIENKIDYTDMLTHGAEYINNGYNPDIKLILIDEFQDISDSKMNLVNSVLSKNKDAKLFAVGDDYQAINGFSGANIKYIYDFEKDFKTDEYGVDINQLTKTFRCNQGIVNYSSDFIQKNPKQIKKAIVSDNKITVDTVVFRTYTDDSDMFKQLDSDIKNFNHKEIFILNRMNGKFLQNNDYKLYMKNVKKFSDTNRIIDNTIHGAKGLECDIVFLIMANKNILPSNISNDSILALITDIIDEYPNAEERRLFYTALTRAKERVYIYSKENQQSKFVS
jgi:DNA helicase-4